MEIFKHCFYLKLKMNKKKVLLLQFMVPRRENNDEKPAGGEKNDMSPPRDKNSCNSSAPRPAAARQ